MKKLKGTTTKVNRRVYALDYFW